MIQEAETPVVGYGRAAGRVRAAVCVCVRVRPCVRVCVCVSPRALRGDGLPS